MTQQVCEAAVQGISSQRRDSNEMHYRKYRGVEMILISAKGDGMMEMQFCHNAFNAQNVYYGTTATTTEVVWFIVRRGIRSRGERQSSVSLFATQRHTSDGSGPVSWRSWRHFVSDPMASRIFGVDSTTTYLGCQHYNMSEMVVVWCFGLHRCMAFWSIWSSVILRSVAN